MNMLLSFTMLIAALPVVDVQFAPDQPLPLVYVDDPLIVQMRPDIGAEANLELQVQAEQHSKPSEIKARDIFLRGGSPYWWAAEGAPKERGYYDARLLVSVQGSPMEFTAHYVRIDRPLPEADPPLYVRIAELTDPLLLAVQAASVKTIRLDVSAATFEADAALAHAMGFKIVAAFPIAQIKNATTWAEELARRLGDHVYRWEIDAGTDAQALKSVAEAILRGGSHGPIAVVVPNATIFERMMTDTNGNGLARAVQAAVLSQENPAVSDIQALRRATERVGLEHFPIHVLHARMPADAGDSPGAVFIQQALENLASGALETAFAPDLLFKDGELGEAMVYVSGLAHRLIGMRYEGQLAFSGATVHLFRDGGRWLLAAWAPKPTEISLRPGEVQDLYLTDAMNNALGVPAEADGSLILPLSPSPLYLTGRGGSLFIQAARNTAKEEAARFAGNPTFQESFPPELIALVGTIARNGNAIPDRINYLSLLRLFPELERRWHTGQARASLAVPAIASLARLARALATVEQETGQAFVEPITGTLSRAEDAQSLYLTSAPPTSIGRERADWLLREVRSLMEEVDTLNTAGYKVEADAVAALAEWRARALEYTAMQGSVPPAIEDILTLEEVTEAMPAADPELVPLPAVEMAPEVAALPQRIVHTVVSGDVLGKIADKYGVTLKELTEWNNLKRNSRLKIGDEIVIHPEGVSQAAEEVMVAAEDTAPDVTPVVVPEPEVEETPAPELEPAPPVPDPEPAQPEIAPEPADASDVEEAAPAGEIIHVVVRGDVPGSIADKYGVPLKDLLAWNDMTRQSILHIGDKLVVRVPGGEAGATPAEPEEAPSIPEPVPEPAPEPEPEPAPAPEPEPETESAPAGAQPDGTERVFHTVARGEFPGKIADKYGVSVDDFFEWNNLTKRSTLHVGDKYVVYIPGDKDKPAAQPSPSETSSTVSADGERIVHVVGRGDNPWSLSRKYGVQVQDIYDWNKWERGHTLHVGDEVILYKKGR